MFDIWSIELVDFSHLFRLDDRFLFDLFDFLSDSFKEWLCSILIKSILLLFVCFRALAGHLNDETDKLVKIFVKHLNWLWMLSICLNRKTTELQTWRCDIECNKMFACFLAFYFDKMDNHRLIAALFLLYWKYDEWYVHQMLLKNEFTQLNFINFDQFKYLNVTTTTKTKRNCNNVVITKRIFIWLNHVKKYKNCFKFVDEQLLM